MQKYAVTSISPMHSCAQNMQKHAKYVGMCKNMHSPLC